MMIVRALLALLLLLVWTAPRAQEPVHADGFEEMAIQTTAWRLPTFLEWFSAAMSGDQLAGAWFDTAHDGSYFMLRDPLTGNSAIHDNGAYPTDGPLVLELNGCDIPDVPAGAVVTGVEVELYAAARHVPLTNITRYIYFGFGGRTVNAPTGQNMPVTQIINGTEFQRLTFGGPLDLWGGADPVDPPAGSLTDPAQWNGTGVFVVLGFTPGPYNNAQVVVDRVAIRLHYIANPPPPGARMLGATVMNATLRARRPVIRSDATGERLTTRTTMTANVNARRNIASRIYDGPLKVGTTMGVHLTRSVGGVRSTYLFPEPKLSTRMSVTLRRAFAAKALGATVMNATLNAMRRALTSAEPMRMATAMNVALIGGRLAIPAVMSQSMAMSVAMTRGRTLTAAALGSTVMTATLRAMRPAITAATPMAMGATMTPSLRARRPIVPPAALTSSTTMTVAIGKARPIAASMVMRANLRGDEGRITPDVSNLFWRPSVESIDSDPWSNDIDSDPWSNDLDGD